MSNLSTTQPAGRPLSRFGARLICGVSAAALVHGAAQAADAAAAAPASTSVQELVVTANRSGAESIQKMAMAISAVSAEQLERTNQTNLTDLTRYAPSLTITEGAPGFNTFEIRGLTAMPYRTSDTSDRSLVAVYLDDTPISVQGQTPDLKIYDLDRVEILRGPQGTLYGAGSMSGTIRFITAKPSTHSFFGTLEGTASGTEHGSINDSFRAMVNIPLIADKLAVRATVYQGEDSGYINDIGVRSKNGVNLDRTSQARVALRWTPTERLTVDASVTYEKSKAYGLNQGLSGLAPYTTSTNGPEGTQDDFSLYNVSWDYDLGFADLISSTSYTWRRVGFEASPEPQIAYFFQNYTGLPLSTTTYPLFNAPPAYSQQVTNLIPRESYDISNKIHDFMQEVRLVSKNDGPIHWTVGAFYEHQRRNLYQDIPVPGFDTLSYKNLSARSTPLAACTIPRRSTPPSSPTTSFPACKTDRAPDRSVHGRYLARYAQARCDRRHPLLQLQGGLFPVRRWCVRRGQPRAGDRKHLLVVERRQPAIQRDLPLQRQLHGLRRGGQRLPLQRPPAGDPANHPDTGAGLIDAGPAVHAATGLVWLWLGATDVRSSASSCA